MRQSGKFCISVSLGLSLGVTDGVTDGKTNLIQCFQFYILFFVISTNSHMKVGVYTYILTQKALNLKM